MKDQHMKKRGASHSLVVAVCMFFALAGAHWMQAKPFTIKG